MPGLPINGRDDKSAQRPKNAQTSQQSINERSQNMVRRPGPSNVGRPTPGQPVGQDAPRSPRLQHATLAVPGHGGPPQVQRSPVRTIIAPPAPNQLGIGRPLPQRTGVIVSNNNDNNNNNPVPPTYQPDTNRQPVRTITSQPRTLQPTRPVNGQLVTTTPLQPGGNQRHINGITSDQQTVPKTNLVITNGPNRLGRPVPLGIPPASYPEPAVTARIMVPTTNITNNNTIRTPPSPTKKQQKLTGATNTAGPSRPPSPSKKMKSNNANNGNNKKNLPPSPTKKPSKTSSSSKKEEKGEPTSPSKKQSKTNNKNNEEDKGEPASPTKKTSKANETNSKEEKVESKSPTKKPSKSNGDKNNNDKKGEPPSPSKKASKQFNNKKTDKKSDTPPSPSKKQPKVNGAKSTDEKGGTPLPPKINIPPPSPTKKSSDKKVSDDKETDDDDDEEDIVEKSPRKKPSKRIESPSPPRKKVTIKSSESPSPTRKSSPTKRPRSRSPTKKSDPKSSQSPSSPKKKPPSSRGSESTPRVERKSTPLESKKAESEAQKSQTKNTLSASNVPPPGRPIPAPITKQQSRESLGRSDSTVDDKSKSSSGKPFESAKQLDRLLVLCNRGDWLAVESFLNHLDGKTIPCDLVDDQLGYTPLMFAVRDNRVFAVERFLNLGMEVNIKAKDGITAMHLSAAQPREDMVRLLLTHRANAVVAGGPKQQYPVHLVCSRPTGAALTPLQLILKATGKEARLMKDKFGNTPLIMALEAGNHSITRELLLMDAKEQLAIRKPDTRDTPLHVASRKRDIELMRMLIEKGAGVNLQNDDGMTPLHIAAMEGDESMLKLLGQANARANILDRRDRAPVHLAAERGHTSAVEILLDRFKASIFQRTKDGSTLMHIASNAGYPEIAMLFMKKGVPIHTSNKSGAKCLHIAAAAGHVEVVRSLLSKGENVDIKTNDGFTALHIAVQGCQPKVVETLLGHGSQIRLKVGSNGETPLHIASRTQGGEKCAELLLKSGAEVNAVQEDGETALHFASRHGHLNTVALLLQDKADLLQKSKTGETALHVATRNCHYAVARSLLDHWRKTNPQDSGNVLINAQNDKGESVLHYAALVTKSQAHHPTEDKDLVRLLLQYGADVSVPNKETSMTPVHYCSREGNADILKEVLAQMEPTMLQGACNKIAQGGWTPLLYACQKGHPEVVKLLLQNSARVDVFDEGGKAALHLAAEFGHGEVVDILLKHKAYSNARSKTGMTPLHLASRNGYTEIASKLVTQYGAVLDALTLAKRTPLHLAAENGKLEVCKVLLEMRADANAIDNTGQTPLLLAAENDHPEVVKLFLRHKPELVSMANSNGFTCAHIAAMKGSVAVIKELMKFNRSMVTSARNMTGNTALHLAAAGGHAEVVKVLLEAGSSATEENSDGYTALHFAAKHGHVKVLQALKTAVSWRVNSKKTGMTALHVAASCGQTEFVQEMLTQIPASIASERPGDTSLSDDYGFTPLHLAAESGHEGVVRVLLNSSGVQTDAATVVQGILPMHLAARGGHLAVAGLLLSRSTEQLQTADKHGRTPLHLASAQGHREMVGLLLGQGADINVADNNGWTALHYTTRHGYLNVVKLLMGAGASPIAASKDGKVPLCLAAGAGHYDVMNYLLKKEHDTETLMNDSSFLIDLMVSSKAHANKPVLEFILVSSAPIETAAKMSRSYQLLSLKEKDRAKDLEAMGDFCENMAADLLGITAISYNTGTLLRSVDSQSQPFLDVLIELQQKEVVAHPAVQKYLTDLWMGSLQWASWKMMLMFMAFLICPIVWIAFSLPLGHRFASIPIIKFMSYLVSHIFFILLISFTIVNPWLPLWQSTHLIPYIHEWLLFLWLIGLWVSDATNPKDREGLGFIKVIIMTVGTIGVMTHALAFVFQDELSRLVCLYIRNQFFAVVLLLCFVEFLNFLTFHHLFGPWTVIIRDLIKDLMRFLAILGIFLVGFSLHLCAIYQPVFLPPGGDNLTLVVFQSPIDTFEMLFFALFGLVEPDYMPPMHLSPGFSKAIMKCVFGVYMMVTVIVLINLLIAMMSNTYQRIQAQSDTEWKFGRAKLIRNMNKTSPSPSPINLFTIVGELIFRCPKKLTGAKPSLAKLKKREVVPKGEVPRIMPAAWQRKRQTRSPQIMPAVQNLTQGRPIAKVIDWPSVVIKYIEITGSDIQMELPEEASHAAD